jgi:hypothetical protein
VGLRNILRILTGSGLSVLGRSSNTSGQLADIVAATDTQVLRRNGTSIGFGTVNLSSGDAVSGTLISTSFPALSGDVVTAVGNTATAININAVTDLKLRDSAALSVIGRSANSLGDPADIVASANGLILQRQGDVLAFSKLELGGASLATGTILSPTFGGTGFDNYQLGNILYCSATDVLAKLPGNTTTTKMFLSQTGNGSVSAAPAWVSLTTSDLPMATQANMEAEASAVVVSPNILKYHPGVVKAWAKIAVNGSNVPSVTAGYNVASVSRTGTGAYTINFTNALSSANNAGSCHPANVSGIGNLTTAVNSVNTTAMTVLFTLGSGTVTDPTNGNFTIMVAGDF